ncbi:MAG: hypothetical protein ABI859_05520 [Pseudomonadota bacterium]
MVKKSLWAATFAAFVLVAGCAGQKEPATQAVAAVENSLAEVKDDATRFAKDQLDTVEAKLADLKASLEQKKYKEVVTTAPELQKQVTTLKEDVAAKRAEFELASAKATESWAATAGAMPAQIEALQKRIDAMVKSRKIQKGVSEESLLLDNVKNMFADAGNLATSGNHIEASAKADEAKAKLAELAAKLKVAL